MAAGKYQYRVLVADSSDKLGAFLSELLPRTDYEITRVCATASQLRRALLEVEADLVILNAPLRDEFGTQLALDLADNNLGVLLLVPGDAFDQVCYHVEDYGIMTLSKPLSREGFYRAVKLLTALRGKLLQMERKQQVLKDKMQDIRIVNQAKWLLIEHLHISENDAHYYIERSAMDNRQSRREAAERIIKSYQ